METKDSLSHNQQPASGPLGAPNQSRSHSQVVESRSISTYFPTDLGLGLPTGFTPSVFPTNVLYIFFTSTPHLSHPVDFTTTIHTYIYTMLYFFALYNLLSHKITFNCFLISNHTSVLFECARADVTSQLHSPVSHMTG
jgi:hypothetical protein